MQMKGMQKFPGLFSNTEVSKEKADAPVRWLASNTVFCTAQLMLSAQWYVAYYLASYI